eukprot:218115_1
MLPEEEKPLEDESLSEEKHAEPLILSIPDSEEKDPDRVSVSEENRPSHTGLPEEKRPSRSNRENSASEKRGSKSRSSMPAGGIVETPVLPQIRRAISSIQPTHEEDKSVRFDPEFPVREPSERRRRLSGGPELTRQSSIGEQARLEMIEVREMLIMQSVRVRDAWRRLDLRAKNQRIYVFILTIMILASTWIDVRLLNTPYWWACTDNSIPGTQNYYSWGIFKFRIIKYPAVASYSEFSAESASIFQYCHSEDVSLNDCPLLTKYGSCALPGAIVTGGLVTLLFAWNIFHGNHMRGRTKLFVNVLTLAAFSMSIMTLVVFVTTVNSTAILVAITKIFLNLGDDDVLPCNPKASTNLYLAIVSIVLKLPCVLVPHFLKT